MNKPSVIAIGLDSAEPELLETWMSQGYLKNLKMLRDKGAYGRLINSNYYKGESAWTNFLTGCYPKTTGYWSKFNFNPQTYLVRNRGVHGAYDYQEIPPFYAVGDDYRVAMFDMPQTAMSDKVNGVQVLAWGAHAPMVDRQSKPAGTLEQILEKYGDHPADTFRHRDRSDWYNEPSVAKLKQELETGLERRTAITKDLLKQERWNLFLTDIGETHTAQHYFWHLSQPTHPLYNPETVAKNGDVLLEFFEKVDQSLGEILENAPKDAHIVVFSVHGQGDNSTDVLSMVALPEFLYRFSFPGDYILKSGEPGTVPPPPLKPENTELGWYQALRVLKRDTDSPSVKFRKQIFNTIKGIIPGRLHNRMMKIMGIAPPPLAFHPTSWYQPFWTQMKAFALPGFSDGYIRINVQGRESQGVVPASDFDAVCNEITEQLYQLVDARNGKPIVKEVVRTRQNPMDSDPKIPDADLAVIWEDWAVDVVDSPKYGRIGPVFFNRTGAHRARGFAVIAGPGIEAGSTFPESHAVDLSPTLLELMGAPIPAHMDGKPVLSVQTLLQEV